MKKLLLGRRRDRSAAAAPVAQAASTTANFNVTVNLTSKCEVTAGPTDVASPIRHSRPGHPLRQAAHSAFVVRNILPYTMSLMPPAAP